MQKFIGILKEITLPAAHQLFDAPNAVILEVESDSTFKVEPFTN